jgi:predicted permease
MYRLLLLLLPRHRRHTYGDEMRHVFAMAVESSRERGAWRVMTLWLREVIAMAKFALRERLGFLRSSGMNEMRWAWRGVRARGWRAVLIVLLFGITLGANAVVFSAADAFVFKTVPYAKPEGLVVFATGPVSMSGAAGTWRDAVVEWRKHDDIFVGIHAYTRGPSAYLTTNGVTEVAPSQLITPGMLELLGVVPAHGRPFVSADAEPGVDPTVIISDALARQLFGEADRALGQPLPAVVERPTIVGVMPASFRFPSAVDQVWRPMDLASWRSNSSVNHVARLRSGLPLSTAAAMTQERLPAIVAGFPMPERLMFNREVREEGVALVSLADTRHRAGVGKSFLLLLSAAACLLLIACANVASLELAAASHRLRAMAVQTALGAARWSLIRVAVLEGALLLCASLAVAALLAFWGLDVLSTQLTVAMRDALVNPLDLDPRVLTFMVLIASATWMVTIVPAVITVSRLSVVEALRHDSRTQPVTRRAARSRQWLMSTQVALTVILLIGAALYIRTYSERIGLEKGLDARAVGTLLVSPAPGAKVNALELGRNIMTRLRALPGVKSLARTWSLPPSLQAGISGPLEIDGRDGKQGEPKLAFYTVDDEYFETMGIAIVEGQAYDESFEPDAVVVDERFAQKYWPDGSSLGARFNIGSAGMGNVSKFRIVGVSRELRGDARVNERGQEVFVAYLRPSATEAPLSFVIKIDDEARLPMIADVARSVAPNLVVRTDTIEARYRRLEADTRLAAAITSGFGTLAWIVAAGGIYAVMAFLVSGRTREIGIRMALGADEHAVRLMVLRSSMRSVAIGAVVGLGAAALAYQSITPQLFGVTPTDPATYAGVTALVIITALIATWFPARRAARVDPAITLRSE